MKAIKNSLHYSLPNNMLVLTVSGYRPVAAGLSHTLMKTALLSLLPTLALATVNAGDAGKAVLPPAESPLGITVSAGYDSAYIYRGVDFGDHLLWQAVDFETNVFSESLILTFGIWHGKVHEDKFELRELDLNFGLDYYVSDEFYLHAGYGWFYFPSTKDGPGFSDGDDHEWSMGFGWGREAGRWSYGLTGMYFLGYSQWFDVPAADDISYYEITPYLGYALSDNLNARLCYTFGDKLNDAENAYENNAHTVLLELERLISQHISLVGFAGYGNSPDDFQSLNQDNLNAFFGGGSVVFSF